MHKLYSIVTFNCYIHVCIFFFFYANIVISKCKCKIKGSEMNFRERIQSESVLNVLRYWNVVFHFLLSAACQHPSPLLIVSRQNLSCVVVPVSTPDGGKLGNVSRVFPSFNRGTFSHVMRLDQSRERTYLMHYRLWYSSEILKNAPKKYKNLFWACGRVGKAEILFTAVPGYQCRLGSITNLLICSTRKSFLGAILPKRVLICSKSRIS